MVFFVFLLITPPIEQLFGRRRIYGLPVYQPDAECFERVNQAFLHHFWRLQSYEHFFNQPNIFSLSL